MVTRIHIFVGSVTTTHTRNNPRSERYPCRDVRPSGPSNKYKFFSPIVMTFSHSFAIHCVHESFYAFKLYLRVNSILIILCRADVLRGTFLIHLHR